ncbi:MAG: quinone oxidoreductase [Acidimicrobiia bacterium]|nr:quinone oxidoreductase [Acidimicrobiia bacterium]
MQAIVVEKRGGPEVLRWTEVPDPVPGVGEVIVDVAAAGVNFIDTYQRSGVYDRPLPFTPGLEVAGTIAAIGSGVDGFEVGDRVVTVRAEGGYAQRTLVSVDAVLNVPDTVGLERAAAVALQGFTAHYLVTDTFPLQPGHRCLIHAGAGGVGGLLVQMAKMRGAEVFTTVGSPDKAEVARAAGADHVIEYRTVDFAEAVRDIIGDAGLDVVYDGVGKRTFDAGLGLLRPRGMFVLFGGASGQVPPFDLQRLNSGGSLYVTRPSLFHYMQEGDGQRRADDVFGWIAEGSLDVRIGAEFATADAAKAHIALESRATTGKVLLR